MKSSWPGFLTQIRPVWIGELETTVGKKLQKINDWALCIYFYQQNLSLAISATVIKI
jgi:hypothetical protein